jgi:sodium/bile acid cotransporter 7
MAGTLSKVGLNGFFFCLIGAIFLAWLYPAIGTDSSPVPLGAIAEYGVSVIFFFYGLKLSPEKLKAGLTNWKMHLLIQASTFVLFPLIILATKYFFQGGSSPFLWMGAFYLAALPSTISSSVVMVSIAGGNMPAAIFNASISSIIGIFITPLWMSGLLEKTDASFDITHVILKLCLEVLLPVILGLLLNKKLGYWADKYKTQLRWFDQFTILLIVYTSFCESFAGNMFSGYSLLIIVGLGALMLLLFFLAFGIMSLVSKWLGFSRADRITVLFCGSKKSLVQGAVMGKVLFPDPLTLGVVLLPLMLYHALQLLAGSTIAQAMGQKKEEAAVASAIS